MSTYSFTAEGQIRAKLYVRSTILSIEEPTAWCAGMVVVQKGNGSIRICVDLRRLN